MIKNFFDNILVKMFLLFATSITIMDFSIACIFNLWNEKIESDMAVHNYQYEIAPGKTLNIKYGDYKDLLDDNKVNIFIEKILDTYPLNLDKINNSTAEKKQSGELVKKTLIEANEKYYDVIHTKNSMLEIISVDFDFDTSLYPCADTNDHEYDAIENKPKNRIVFPSTNYVATMITMTIFALAVGWFNAYYSDKRTAKNIIIFMVIITVNAIALLLYYLYSNIN